MAPIRLTHIPLITALLPAVAIHVSYLVAANAGHVPWCVPYIDGCASISATGRQGVERLIFRATIMPTAVLMMLFWTLSYHWLKALGSPWRRASQTMLALGIAACFGLLLYTTVLGEVGDAYQLQRRLGVTFFYALSVLAQVILTLQIDGLARTRAAAVSRAVRWTLGVLCVAVLVVGVVNLALPASFHNGLEDAAAWIATLLIFLHFLVTGRAWRESGFGATFVVAITQSQKEPPLS